MITGADRELVYDLGMHDGQDTDFYLKKGFRVVAIEANPALVAEARQRFAHAISDGRLTIVDRAVASTDAELEFYVNLSNSKWSSIHEEWGNRGRKGFDKVAVKGIRLQDVMAEHGVPYYMKIDIEGADGTALEQLAGMTVKPAFVSVEGGWMKYLNMFAAMGYDRFALVNQALVSETRPADPPREGRAVDHSFPMGASGPFGREVAAPWWTYDEISADRRAFQKLMEQIGREAGGDPAKIQAERERRKLGWYDVHATTQAALA